MTAKIHGVVPVLPTPFTSRGEIDDQAFARVIDVAVSTGVDAVAMFGLASEYYKLADKERAHLSELLIRQVARRCPAILSITPHATDLAVAEAVRAVELGADALMLLPPFFLGTPTADVIRHIGAVASAVPVPVIVQYAPIQTGSIIDAKTFASVCRDYPNISHIKVDLVPSGPIISALAENGVATLVGYMGLHLPEDFARGVGGVMPTVSVTPAMVEIWRSLAENPSHSIQLHARILPFLSFLMQSVEFVIACEKQLLFDAGIVGSPFCREPRYKLDTVQATELRAYRSQLGSLLIQGDR